MEAGNDGISHGGQIFGGVTCANATGVFAERDVAHPVQAVLDLPQPAPPRQQLPCVGLPARHAGQGVLHVGRFPAVTRRFANDPADLPDVRPVEVVVEFRRTGQRAAFQPAAVLFEGFCSLPVLFIFLLNVGGKSLRFRRRRIEYLV